jgi:hypothetical protein
MSFTRLLALGLALALPLGTARADRMASPAAAHLGPLVLTGGFPAPLCPMPRSRVAFSPLRTRGPRMTA